MSDLQIKFDKWNELVDPLIVLGKRNGNKINGLKYNELILSDKLNDVPEFTCSITKMIDGKKNPMWDNVKNFSLGWVKDWDTWFELTIDKKHSTEVTKNISATRLGEAELSNINVYGLEVNNMDDDERVYEDNWIPTVLYDPSNSDASLLDRVLSFAPHYHVGHVDSSLIMDRPNRTDSTDTSEVTDDDDGSLQRQFSFDDKSIEDCFNDIAEEYDCIITYPSHSSADGTINREVCVYDLEPHCECGYRSPNLKDKCPKCGSTNILPPYGNDTTIFISPEDLSSESTLSVSTDEIKNCFKLESADDDMTVAIINSMPSGSKYYWYFSDDMKSDMSEGLLKGIEKYENLFEEYYNNHIFNLDSSYVSYYNDIINEYKQYNDDQFSTITTEVATYPKLAELYYSIKDLYYYLNDSLMPTFKMDETNAKTQGELVAKELTKVSVSKMENASTTVVNNVIKNALKAILDTRYQGTVSSSEYNNDTHKWIGTIEISNYSNDEDDKSTITDLEVSVDDDYETYVKQQIDLVLKKSDSTDYSISGTFKRTEDDFKNEMTKYSLSMLNLFRDAGQVVVDILIQQGVADNNGFAQTNMYTEFFMPYRRKLDAVEAAISTMESKVEKLVKYDSDGNLADCFYKYVYDIMCEVFSQVNIEKCVGKENLKELYSFRRDNTYSNDNYAYSDDETNLNLFKNASRFVKTIQEEIYKSANMQNSVSVSLNNILSNEKFKPLLSHFKVGNWMRVLVDDEVYKLRMIDFQIDYKNNDISVDFSDAVKTISGLNDSASIMSSAASMSKSYNYVKRQAFLGSKANKTISKISGGISL